MGDELKQFVKEDRVGLEQNNRESNRGKVHGRE